MGRRVPPTRSPGSRSGEDSAREISQATNGTFSGLRISGQEEDGNATVRCRFALVRRRNEVAKAAAGPHGARVHLFLSNPHVANYPVADGQLPGYDVLTEDDPTGYSVPYNRVNIADGDIGLVYRVFEPRTSHRRPGKIVAVARIRSTPFEPAGGWAAVNWDLRALAPEFWITDVDMEASGLWRVGKFPFLDGTRISQPVGQTAAQWNFVAAKLPASIQDWLDKHAARAASLQ